MNVPWQAFYIAEEFCHGIWHCAKCFAFLISCNPFNNVREMQLFFPLLLLRSQRLRKSKSRAQGHITSNGQGGAQPRSARLHSSCSRSGLACLLLSHTCPDSAGLPSDATIKCLMSTATHMGPLPPLYAFCHHSSCLQTSVGTLQNQLD